MEPTEIIVDLFAGGGGASEGIHQATGRHPDAAINHSPQAVAIHAANHPETVHWCQDVWSVDPSWVSRGRPVGLLWASPDCTHHSKAKGGAPNRDEKRRDLAMVISHKWVPALRPRVIILENVEEFKDWGPLNSNGLPVQAAKGEHFKAFVNKLRRYGYKVEWRELVACDYGAPTTRKRLFLIARNDKRPIVWPEPTHGAPDSPEVLEGKRLPWRTAAEIIDWSLPCPSIFATSEEIWEEYGLRAVRPLAENTLRRIAKGLKRYVLDSASPFIVNLAHTKKDGTYDYFRGSGIADPLGCVTQSSGYGVVMPYMVGAGGPKYAGKPKDVASPLGTVVGKNHRALVMPYMSKMRGENVGHGLDEALSAITSGGKHHMLTVPFIQHVQHSKAENGTMSAAEPARTITAQPKGGGMAVIAPILSSYYGSKSENDCRARPGDGQVPALTTENRVGVVEAFLVREFGNSVGSDCAEPAPTVMASGMGKTALAGVFLDKYYTKTGNGYDVEHPLDACTTKEHFALVEAFLLKYYGSDQDPKLEDPLHTVTTKHRFGLVIVHINGEPYAISDIGIRMLTPRELARAQGFPDSYILDKAGGKPVSKTAQVAMIGNSVCPPLAKILVESNYAELSAEEIVSRRSTSPLLNLLGGRSSLPHYGVSGGNDEQFCGSDAGRR